MSKINSKQLVLYKSLDGKLKLEMALENETLWLTQQQIAELFAKDKSTISRHIRNIFTDGELEENSVVAKNATTASDGKTYQIEYYNLDMIISVGYRVNSTIATQFRKWATQILKEYLIKGFVLDDERMMESEHIHRNNYFHDLLERIRAIRSSERFLYEKVKAIFATSIDYHANSKMASGFYATIQNKFHFAVTGMTAAETVINRIDSHKNNMGLTSFKKEIPSFTEAKTGKNYLNENELRQLYLISEQFLSFAELKIQRQQVMYMKDWKTKLDEILRLNDFQILLDSGKTSHAQMEKIVKKEMKRYKNFTAVGTH